MTKLVIARHGNTFENYEDPRRIGCRTDLPLVKAGRDQAEALGLYLKEHKLIPTSSYASPLRRTFETAKIALHEAGVENTSIFPFDIFTEIDYGPDENKLEKEVIARIGEKALQDWDEKAIVPKDWIADPAQITRDWVQFAEHIAAEAYDVAFVVTSNGIARFVPHITGDFDGFSKNHNIKLSTGALCILEYVDERWIVRDWNIKPSILT